MKNTLEYNFSLVNQWIKIEDKKLKVLFIDKTDIELGSGFNHLLIKSINEVGIYPKQYDFKYINPSHGSLYFDKLIEKNSFYVIEDLDLNWVSLNSHRLKSEIDNGNLNSTIIIIAVNINETDKRISPVMARSIYLNKF